MDFALQCAVGPTACPGGIVAARTAFAGGVLVAVDEDGTANA